MLAIEREDFATTPNEQARTANNTGYALPAPGTPTGSESPATEVFQGSGPAHTSAWAIHTHSTAHGVTTDTDLDAVPPLDPADLPSANALICALAGRPPECVLCRSAYELVGLHRRGARPLEWPETLRTRRAALVRGIDHWARRLPPPRHGARAHSESLGVLIDRIAAAAASAFHLLMTDDVAGDSMHAAWTRLAELELDYADLLSDIRSGRRYLPPHAALTEWDGG
jgi:hypothetical protein